MHEHKGYTIYCKDGKWMVYYYAGDDGSEFDSLEAAIADIDEFLEE